MDLEQLRLTMASTGRVAIHRRRPVSAIWLIGAALLGASSAITLVDGLMTASTGSVVLGAVFLLVSMIAVGRLLVDLLGRPAAVVDAEGIHLGGQVAPWSRIATIEPTESVYQGLRQTFVRVQDADGRALFRAPLLRSVPRHTLPRALAVRRPDWVTFLQEELLRRTRT